MNTNLFHLTHVLVGILWIPDSVQFGLENGLELIGIDKPVAIDV